MSAPTVATVSSETPRRRPTVLRRLVQMCAGLLGAVVLAEILLRLFHLAPAQGIATVNARQFERIPGMFAPNQHVRDLQKPALPYWVTIDSLGFRGEEFPRQKPANQFRLVMVGDSYVYGDFVDDNQTLPFQLEQRLRRDCGDALVVNAGLGGTTIVDQAYVMQRALTLAPDVVVLVYVVDDVSNLAGSKTSWELFAENRAKKSRFPLSIVYPVLRSTALWNLALKVRAMRMNQAGETSLSQDYARDSASTTNRLRERYGAALLAFRDTLKAHGVRMVFAMYPSAAELRNGSANLPWLTEFAGKNGIAALNLTAPLLASQQPDTTLYQLPEDGHPSPTGYAITSDVLAATVLGAAAPPSCHR